MTDSGPTDLRPTHLSSSIISDELRKRIFTEYVSFLYKACSVFGIQARYIEFNDRELALAVEEAEIDLQAMLARRSRRHGITPGKIAGVIAFRLSRFKILHFTEQGWANSHYHLV